MNDIGSDPKYLRDIILNFIIAGKDTTATALSWFIYMLCKNPDIQEKVAREVRDAIDWKEAMNYADFAAGVTEEVLEKMQYLHGAITETLRLYPAVPVVMSVVILQSFTRNMLPTATSNYFHFIIYIL